MTDITASDTALAVLREQEAEFQQEARDASLRLETVRGLIARLNQKQRAVRRPRPATPEDAAQAPAVALEGTTPQPVGAALEGALERLGEAVRAAHGAPAMADAA